MTKVWTRFLEISILIPTKSNCPFQLHCPLVKIWYRIKQIGGELLFFFLLLLKQFQWKETQRDLAFTSDQLVWGRRGIVIIWPPLFHHPSNNNETSSLVSRGRAIKPPYCGCRLREKGCWRGRERDVLSREERDERKRVWYRARSCSFGTFVFGPFWGVMHFFVVVCLFVCLFEVVPMTWPKRRRFYF